MSHRDAQLWPRVDELFDRADQMFKTFERLGRDPYVVTRVTYTTDSTAVPKPPQPGTYSDGFDDGWNARDAAG